MTATASAQQRPLPETPAEYEQFAVEQNADLQALHKQWRAAKFEAKSADSSWPQPSITYQGRFDLPGVEDRGGRHMGGVAQKFPWPGVLDKASKPARKEAKALRHRFKAKLLEITFEVRKLLIEIAETDRTQQILREKLDIYRDIISTVEAHLGSNEANYGDLLRVKTAREKIADRLDGLSSDRRQLVSRLKTHLDLAQSKDLTFDFDDSDLLVDTPVSDKQPELVRAAKQNHPALSVDDARAAAEIARAEYAWAKRLPWPTASLGVQSRPMMMGGGQIDRQNALMVQLSVPLPLFTGQHKDARKQFRSRKSAILTEKDRLILDLEADIDSALTRIDEKTDRLQRYRDDLIPLAEDSTEQMLQQIESGDRSITDYLLSFEQQLDLETNVVDFRAAIAIERARLQKLTGGTFETYPDRESPTLEIQEVAQ
jgi:outer membrane protein TolC